MVDKDTKLFFSVSSKPGNFGSSLYNKAFQELNINAIYKPLKLEEKNDFKILLESLKFLGASGLSVSMPFKRLAHHYSRHCEWNTSNIKNANTMVFSDDGIRCYNTDYVGFLESCKDILDRCKNVVIYGTGSVSDSIFYALRELKRKSVWRIERGHENLLLKNKETKEEHRDEMLINATPVGMDGVEDRIFTEEVVGQFKYVFDVVVKKETNLIGTAKRLGVEYVNGVHMSLEQLCKQFEIYTGKKPPRELFIQELKNNDYW